MACDKCKSPGCLQRTEVRAYPSFVVVLGYVLWVPAACILGLTLIGIGAGLLAGGGAMFGSIGSAEIGAGVLGFLLTLPFLAAGTFLTRKRKVWRCNACSYVFERA